MLRQGAAGVKPGVLQQFELASTELEDDTLLSWTEENGSKDEPALAESSRGPNPLSESGRRPGLIAGLKVCFSCFPLLCSL